jgi:hypothetical protein
VTVGEVRCLTDFDILRIPNIGATSFNEIRAELGPHKPKPAAAMHDLVHRLRNPDTDTALEDMMAAAREIELLRCRIDVMTAQIESLRSVATSAAALVDEILRRLS